MQRLALRWLTRRPARHIGLASTLPGSLRASTVAVAVFSLVAGVLAMVHGVPADVALPGMLLAPLLAEHWPGRLDARAREHVRSVEGPSACRYLQRLAVLHTYLVQAAASTDRYELRRSAEIGQCLMWDAADLLHTHDIHSASTGLIYRERLMLQLADQVAHILKTTAAQPGPAGANACRPGLLAVPYPPTPAHRPGRHPGTPPAHHR
ncbi:hypothetical protein ACF08N_35545 [Streptomyces sp. NPDC015127]|uniref:hypothetical protein n=1 Tax=Streptomyces sp. NPDC015127 TaxID=3364939 RepID=UPI0036FF6F1A